MTTPPSSHHTEQLGPLCSLDDPTRASLYRYVAAQARPVTRDEASQATGIDRPLVAYHLDKLVDEGLLATSFARPEGRGGPGAGRPAKHYERTDREFTASVPPRDYHLAAELLARAAEVDRSGNVQRALDEAASQMGRELADGDDDLVDHLARQGFEPYTDEGVIRLRNCPFHRLARQHTDLVCGMNLALLTGTAEALGGAYAPTLDPAEGRCCVAFHPTGDHNG